MDEINNNIILTQEQKALLLSFSDSPLSSVFYLSGGTALSAFFLHHRLSEDLDFFTDQDIDIENVLIFLRSISGVKQTSYERKYDRRIFMLEYSSGTFLKVEFTKYPFEKISPAQKIGNVFIDSIEDILANKLMAMTDRKDPKDYIDVYFILQAYPHFKIEEAIRQSEKKFGLKGIGSILSGRFLELPALNAVHLASETKLSDIKPSFHELARRLIRRTIG